MKSTRLWLGAQARFSLGLSLLSGFPSILGFVLERRGAGTSEIIEASEVDMVVDIDRSVAPGPALSFVDGHILPRGEPDMLRSGSWHVQRVRVFFSTPRSERWETRAWVNFWGWCKSVPCFLRCFKQGHRVVLSTFTVSRITEERACRAFAMFGLGVWIPWKDQSSYVQNKWCDHANDVSEITVEPSSLC